MERGHTTAILFASPGFAGDGGGIIITPTGVHRIPPWTMKVRSALDLAVATFVAMRDPDCLPPGPMQHPHKKMMEESGDLLVRMTKNVMSTVETVGKVGIIICVNYITGNYIWIDEQGHVHHVVVDPRANDIFAAALTFMQVAEVKDAGVMKKVQETVEPFLKMKVDELVKVPVHS